MDPDPDRPDGAAVGQSASPGDDGSAGGAVATAAGVKPPEEWTQCTPRAAVQEHCQLVGGGEQD